MRMKSNNLLSSSLSSFFAFIFFLPLYLLLSSLSSRPVSPSVRPLSRLLPKTLSDFISVVGLLNLTEFTFFCSTDLLDCMYRRELN